MKVYKIAYLGEDKEVILALERELKVANFKLVTAPGDYNGMRKVAESNPDLILWDLDNDPEPESFSLDEFRRADIKSQPIICVARRGSIKIAVRCLSSGAADVIFKPIGEPFIPRAAVALNFGEIQKRLEWSTRIIEDTNNQIRGILANLRDPAYIVSLEFHILYMNRAAEEIFGEGLRGGACYTVFYDRSEPCEVCSKSTKPGRWRAVLKNGKIYRFVSALVSNSSGELERIAIGIDITPDQEVKKIHKTFISNVSHDLRTPISTIDQYASIMLDGLTGELNEEQKKCIEVIKRSNFRLFNLVENLIDANRILSGDFKLRMEITSVREVMDLVLDRLKAQADDKGLKFEVIVPDELPKIYVDKARIAQAIANIAGNAIKFTDEGMVQVRAGYMPRDEGRIIVSVEDTGIGIPREDLGKIFDLFYRVEGDRVYVEEGAGLGLSISREIIRAHGGTLWAESVEGVGSAFHMTLPAHR